MIPLQRTCVKKVSGGKLLKVQVRSDDGVLKEIRITGDFFVSPEETVDDIEEALKGVHVAHVQEVVRDTAESKGAAFLGFSLQDLVGMIEECAR